MKILTKNESGFSLVEVLVASGIMGVMAVFFYKSFNDNMKQQKTVITRMEEANIINEIRLLLMNQENCSATLKGQRFSLNVKGLDTLEEPINFLQKVMVGPPKDGEESKEKIVKEKFELYEKGENEIVHGNARVKITGYSLKYSKAVVDNLKKVGREEVDFLVNFSRNSSNFGTAEKAYKVPLEITVDANMELETCSSLGLPAAGKAGILVLNADKSPSLLNMTGNAACKSKGMDCAYVQSTNYVLQSNGVNAPLYTPACSSSYNKKMEGVKLGVGVSNVHTCEAKLGSFETFNLDVGDGTTVNCGGTFVAFCN